MLGTSALNVKSRTFYNNYGCNTKKMKCHRCNTKVHTKNMDFSNIIISATCYLARDLILYFIAAWPSPDLFSQDKKWTSVKIVFISKFLVKTKEVNFSFFTFSRLLMMTFFFCIFQTSIISLLTITLITRCSIDVQMGYCFFTNILCDVCTT